MVESLIREVILGLVIGCVFHIFFYMLYVAGDFLDTVFGPVSYTHLDVYKRQVEELESYDKKGETEGAPDFVSLLSSHMKEHFQEKGQRNRQDKNCLLYTSRCV